MTTTSASAPRIDHFFSAVAARLDRWRDLNRAAQTWAAHPSPREERAMLKTLAFGVAAILAGGSAWDERLSGERIDRALAECKSKPETPVPRAFTDTWSR